MKKMWLIITLFIISFIVDAKSSDWEIVQVTVVPKGTPIYRTYTDSGKVKYTISLNMLGVPVSQANAEKYLANQVELEIVKWRNIYTGKYRYTCRQHMPNYDIDLERYFKEEQVVRYRVE
jgi:hypothetical protein